MSRRRTSLPGATPVPVLTWDGNERTIVPPDGEVYYAFPGAVTCPNGDVLVMFRNGYGHLSAGDLVSMRSTDQGATWTTPTVAIPATATNGYGTANLSIIPGTSTIALVTWMRPIAGGYPLVDGTRIFLSTDNGATWGSPNIVDTADWLTRYNVSESALVYRGGYYYLGMWGESLANIERHYIAGVVRSSDLVTWEHVATFDTGAQDGFNETGVAAVGNYLVAVIRNESGGLRWSSISWDGATWTDPRSQAVEGDKGAPKICTDTFLDVGLVALRNGNQAGFIASVDHAGNLTWLRTLTDTAWFIYGQVCRFSETSGGVAFAIDAAQNEIRWRSFTLAPAT